MGVNGEVGQAAVQIAIWRGAKVIGVVRKDEGYEGHANGDIEIVNSETMDVAARVRELTGGKGPQIIFNTVGSPYFQVAHKSLAFEGRQILIATVEKLVHFDILEFYRGRHAYFGIDTLAFSFAASAKLLRAVLPGFVGKFLRPYPIEPSAIYRLSQAKDAYLAVSGSSRNRVVAKP